MELFKIVSTGDIQKLNEKVKLGVDVSVRDEDGGTLLHKAARCGRLDLFVYLTEQGLDPYVVDKNGRTVLHWAAYLEGDDDVVKYICTNFPELLNKVDVSGWTALHSCAQGGSVAIFKFLISQGMDYHAVSTAAANVLHVACINSRYGLVKHIVSEFPDLKNKVDVNKWTALHYCVFGFSLDIFKFLVSQGLDVTAVSRFGGVVLHGACRSGRYEMVKYIVSEFPDLKSMVNYKKWTALHYCAHGGNVDIFKFLVSQGLDVTSVADDASTVLHIACLYGRYELVKYIVSTFPYLKNKVDAEKWTALHYCAKGGSVDIFKFLVGQGMDYHAVSTAAANVLHVACINSRYELVKHIVSEFPDLKNKVDVNKWTALHYCVFGFSLDIFKFLVSQGLDVTAESRFGGVVLHGACRSGRYEMVKYIVSEFPDLKSMANYKKWTALHYCAHGGSVDIFKFLISQGLDVTSIADDASTVLHIACLHGRYELVRYIAIAYPKMVTATTTSGETPLDLACKKNHQKIIDFLHQHQEKAATTFQGKGLQWYSMTRKPRGYCIIINNIVFDNDPKATRHGSEIDEASLSDTFGSLNFTVRIRRNLSDVELMGYLIDIARADHTRFDCFVCCIMSHGLEGIIECSNGMCVKTRDITNNFQANRCPSLAGKPKLFFYQACQGENEQTGIEVQTDRMAIDAVKEIVPNEGDFLIGYATVPGYASYRYPTEGSLYIQALCNTLEKYSYSEEMLNILTLVNAEVSAKDVDRKYKQMPTASHQLRKKLIFK